MKIFIGLTEIAGYYANLARGFNEVGVEATFVSSEYHPFNYSEDEPTSQFIRFFQYVKKKQWKELTPKSHYFVKLWWRGLFRLSALLLFLWSTVNFDVFIFGFGGTFSSNYYDLPLLKLLGKHVIFVFNGSDSRPPYINGWLVENSKNSFEHCIKDTRQQKSKITKIERYADAIVNHSLSAHFHERPFIQWLHIGIPCEILDGYSKQEPGSFTSESIRILHAPSRPTCKGTPMIRQTIENLKAKGYPINYVEITGQPHRAVLTELKQCDFVIDELYSDTPMATFATEAAFFGKPAVVGGYGWDELQRQISADKLPPAQICHPDHLEVAVEKLITDRKYRIELGCKAREFVTSNWTRANVAQRFLQIIKGDIPAEWMFDPQNIRYLHGWGLPEQKAKVIIKKMIEAGGKEALQLADKSALERLIVQFADT